MEAWEAYAMWWSWQKNLNIDGIKYDVEDSKQLSLPE